MIWEVFQTLMIPFISNIRDWLFSDDEEKEEHIEMILAEMEKEFKNKVEIMEKKHKKLVTLFFCAGCFAGFVLGFIFTFTFLVN